MEKLIVNIFGVGIIGIIYWYFFGKKEDTIETSNHWNIIVDGGYRPGTIRIFKNKPTTITFARKDPNSCLEEIVFPDYKIKKYLPLNKEVTVTLPAPHKQSGFHCGMNMFHGRIEVL